MNIARSLPKPAVTRSMRKRRARRIKFAFRLFVCLICMASACYALYWTAVGAFRLFNVWFVPSAVHIWHLLLRLSPGERFALFSRVTWVATVVGLFASVVLMYRVARWANWVAFACFACCYAFLWHVLWLVLRSFIDLAAYVENGLIGCALVLFVYTVQRFRDLNQRSDIQKNS